MISERSQRLCGDPCLVHLYVVLTNDPIGLAVESSTG